MSPKTYIQRLLVGNLQQDHTFGEMPKKYSSPMEKNDSPELDDSALLGPDDIKKHQSIIGALQWCITLLWGDLTYLWQS